MGASFDSSSEQVLGDLYNGAWRSDSPPLEVSLEQLIPVLGSILQSGTAGLVWPRIRHRADEYGVVGEMLEHTYQQYLNALQQIETDIALVASMLADAGIEAVLVKGWSLSRLYAPPQVRRPGDIDLIIPTGRKDEAERIIAQAHVRGLKTSVDLYDDLSWPSIPSPDFRRDLLSVNCNGAAARVLNPTDQLRHVCLHFIKHLRGRHPSTSPLWLCDIGVVAERFGSEIDWEVMLGGSTVNERQIPLALALSRDLVGVDPAQLPAQIETLNLPIWVTEAMHKLWSEPRVTWRNEMTRSGIVGAVWKYVWPDRLNALLAQGAPLDTEHPLYHKFETCLQRTALYGTRVITLGRFGR